MLAYISSPYHVQRGWSHKDQPSQKRTHYRPFSVPHLAVPGPFRHVGIAAPKRQNETPDGIAPSG
jgi:hypothetical protein